MNTITMNEFNGKPRINIITIRDMIESETLSHDDAERIALAITASINDQDTTGFATKGDILEIKSDIKIAIAEMQTTMYKVQAGSLVILLTAISKMVGWW